MNPEATEFIKNQVETLSIKDIFRQSEQNESLNSELYYEAHDTLQNIFQRSDKNSHTNILELKNCFHKNGKSLENKINSNVDQITNFNKIISNSKSNYGSKKTFNSENIEKNSQDLLNNQNLQDLSYITSTPIINFISENKSNSTKNPRELNLSCEKYSSKNLIKNEKGSFVNINHQKHSSPISMKFNNNISAQSKINLNFSININCDGNINNKTNQIQSEQNKSILINSINLNDKEKSKCEIIQESIYESVRNYDKNSIYLNQNSNYESDDSKNSSISPNYSDKEFVYEVPDIKCKIENMEVIQNSHKQHLENNQIFLNHDYITKSSVTNRKDTIEDLISDVPYLINKRRMSEIKFEIKYDIDMNFIRIHFKNVPVKTKQVSNHNRHFRNLHELQNFEIDTHQIWIVRISPSGKYIAAGGKSGLLKIYQILNFNPDNYKDTYSPDEIFNYMNFVNETPMRTYNDHSNDIIDLCWSSKKNKILLTASLDHLIIMWNVDYDYPLAKFNHSSIVTCVSFCPETDAEDEEKFVSGCLDKYIRIWSISKKKVIDYTNMKEYITSISYFPTGDMIVVGTHNGRCSVYDCKPKLKYNFSFSCKNRLGKYSYGRKITNIEFVNRTQALITTNDSRIRLVNISDGKMIQKYKGHLNEEYMIRAFVEDYNDMVISASEDGNVFAWTKYNKESNRRKNYNYEMFRPFAKDTSSCSILVGDECTAQYMKKLFNLTNKVMIYSIVINASVGGRLQVLLNCDEI